METESRRMQRMQTRLAAVVNDQAALVQERRQLNVRLSEAERRLARLLKTSMAPLHQQSPDDLRRDTEQKAGTHEGLLSWEVPPDYDFSKSTKEVHATFVNDGDSGSAAATTAITAIGEYAAIRQTRDASYHGYYTKERQAYQDVLIRNVVCSASVKAAPWVVFTAGAMGAGKGYTVAWMFNQGIFPINDFISIDPDHFKHELPEWQGYVQVDPMTAGSKCHSESGYLVEIAQDYALSTGKNVWVDGSLRDSNWYSKVFQDIRERFPHYQIAIIHVSAATEIVLQRAKKRGEVTGRFVPEDVLMQSIKAVPESVAILEPLADFTAHVLNEGKEPTLYTVSKHRIGQHNISSSSNSSSSNNGANDAKTHWRTMLSTVKRAEMTLATRQHCGSSMKVLGSWNEIASRFVTNKFLIDSKLGEGVIQKLNEFFVKDIGVVLFSKSYCSYCSRLKNILHAAGFRDYTLVELDELDEGIALFDCLQQRSGITTVPQLFSDCELVATCERFDPFPKMASKAQQMVRLILGQHSDHIAAFAVDRPRFDDASDTIYLLIGGVYRDGVACRTCMYSQKVETLYSSCDIDYTPVLIDFNDKPAWFLEEASTDGTTPVARHRGKWISGSATLLQYCYGQYPQIMAKITSVAPALGDGMIAAVTKAMEAWIMIDPTHPASNDEWTAARACYLATLAPINERLEATRYLCGNETPGREDYVWFPAIESTFAYLSVLCAFDPTDSEWSARCAAICKWAATMSALPEVVRCATVNSTKIRVNRLIKKLQSSCPWMEGMLMVDKVLLRERLAAKRRNGAAAAGAAAGAAAAGSSGSVQLDICI